MATSKWFWVIFKLPAALPQTHVRFYMMTPWGKSVSWVSTLLRPEQIQFVLRVRSHQTLDWFLPYPTLNLKGNAQSQLSTGNVPKSQGIRKDTDAVPPARKAEKVRAKQSLDRFWTYVSVKISVLLKDSVQKLFPTEKYYKYSAILYHVRVNWNLTYLQPPRTCLGCDPGCCFLFSLDFKHSEC